ncbi:MAG: hypothetical protein L0I79_04755, partial [Atopostipes sp.]|nr:hypothetical protein [Atopostipes sp.]
MDTPPPDDIFMENKSVDDSRLLEEESSATSHSPLMNKNDVVMKSFYQEPIKNGKLKNTPISELNIKSDAHLPITKIKRSYSDDSIFPLQQHSGLHTVDNKYQRIYGPDASTPSPTGVHTQDNKYQRLHGPSISINPTAFLTLFHQLIPTKIDINNHNTIELTDELQTTLTHKPNPVTAYTTHATGVEENGNESVNKIDLVHQLGGPPRNFQEAMSRTNSNEWVTSLKKELDQHNKNSTWTLVKRPKFKTDNQTKAKVMKSRWVLTYKISPEMDNYQLKSRLVLKGYEQQEGIDYNEVYAPTVRPSAVRLFSTVAAKYNMDIHQMDVCTAFLNGILEEEVYMEQPPGFEVYDEENKKMVCKLNKSIYGLKQAPRCWYKTINGFLISINFERSIADKGIYIFRKGNIKLLLCLYVDDLLLACDNQEMMKYVKERLNERFEMKDMGPAKMFLGVEIKKVDGGYTLSQSKYIENILKRFDYMDVKPRSTPADNDWSKFNRIKDKTELLDEKEINWYQKVVGSLHYLVTWTRPDLATTARLMSQQLVQPTKAQKQWVLRVMQYLKGTMNEELVLVPNGSKVSSDEDMYQRKKREMTGMDLVGYTDADFANEPDRKSISGSVIFYCGCPVSWKTKKQTLTSLSTTEAEMYAAHSTIREGLFLKNVIQVMDGKDSDLIILEDNKGTISLAKEGNYSERTKHIGVVLNFVYEKVKSGLVQMKYIKTDFNIADTLTKALGRNLFRRHRDSLLNTQSNHRVEVLDADV